jgi:hypothetical protein
MITHEAMIGASRLGESGEESSCDLNGGGAGGIEAIAYHGGDEGDPGRPDRNMMHGAANIERRSIWGDERVTMPRNSN